MTCRSCRFSIYYNKQVWCRLWDWPGDRRCTHFVYQPGTDEGVQ